MLYPLCHPTSSNILMAYYIVLISFKKKETEFSLSIPMLNHRVLKKKTYLNKGKDRPRKSYGHCPIANYKGIEQKSLFI